MKRKCIVLFLVLATGFLNHLSAQIDSSTFIGINNYGRMYVSKIAYKQPLFKKPYFIVDDTLEYSLEQIQYYQNENGFFLKNTIDEYAMDEFLHRETQGKISIYSKWVYNTGYYNPGAGMYMGSNSRKSYFYTKEDLNIKNFTYSNLQADMQDNPVALKLITEAKKMQTVQTVLIVTGAAVILGGVLTAATTKSVTPGLPIAGCGAALILSSWIPYFDKEEKQNRAIAIYNK